jgi:hypothetical protein
MKVCVIGCLVCSMLFGQVLYEEHFTGGAMQLDWHPWFAYAGSNDSMQVISDATTPEGDGWAGKITNELAGGQAGATYSGSHDLDDYSVEAWIYTTVTPPMPPMPGPYNGITMRMDTASHNYYSLISDFDIDGRLRLSVYTGVVPSPVLRNWTAGEVPGGLPVMSSWHKFKMRMIADSVWCWYDDILLPDCPIIDTVGASTQGFFGVYVFSMTGVDSTKCDGIVVAGPVGIEENASGTTNFFTIYPNPFRHYTDIRYLMSDDRLHLKVYDACGKLVKDLGLPSVIGHQSSVQWDGRDAAGNMLAPGVYFIREASGRQIEKVVKLR